MKILQWILTLAELTIGKWRGDDKISQWITFCRCLKFTKSRLKISFLILINITTNPLLSQKEAAIWYFGNSAGLDFNTNPASSLTNSKMDYALEASGTVCDNNGNLLFYTNGQTIWNKNHEIMEEGTNLDGSENASQNGLILNHPDNDSLYYIFLTPFSSNFAQGMKYCLVNINGNNGLGKVVEKNVLLHPNSSEKISAVYHTNGKDVWIVGHEWGNNNFFLYLLTSNGFNKCPIINSIGFEYKSSPYSSGIATNQGFIKFSLNHQYMAHVFTPNDPFNIFSELYKINRTNGRLELFKTIPLTAYPWGAEFSSNSENLFLCRRDSSVLVYNIPSDQYKTIDSLILPATSQLQLSIDGKIYFGKADSTYVGSLNNVNDFDNIQVNKKAVNLSKGKMKYGFPNIFGGYLTHGQPRIHYQNQCSGHTFDFNVAFADNIIKWIFTHQNLFNEFERTSSNPSVTFADTGLWIVHCLLASNDTVVTSIFVEPAITPNFLGNDTGWCEQLGATLALQAPSGMHCYEWSNGSSDNTITADTSGTYWAKITTSNFCVIYDSVVISIDTFKTISNNFLGENKTWCENFDTSVILTAPADMHQYLWSTGETIQQIEVDTTGIYWVQASARNQCETGGNLTITDTVLISLDTVPNIPEIYRDNDTLKTNAVANNYQWFKYEQKIGNNEPKLTVTDTGVYKLQVTNIFGCSAFSDTIHVPDTANISASTIILKNFKLYPNPATNELIIEVIDNDGYSYEITGAEGNLIISGNLMRGENIIDITLMSVGIYFVHVLINKNKVSTYKLIKENN